MEKAPLKIGIMGGSFDPVHLGHVCLAADALDQAGLDKVIIVPADIQPFKQDANPASGSDRIRMLEIAFEDFHEIEISPFEIEKGGVSYTYETMRAMQEKYGAEARLYFICGTDSMLKVHTWKNSDELLKDYSFVVGSRPGYRDDELSDVIDRLRRVHDTEIIKIDNRLRDVSSTELRGLIADGKAIDHLVGDEVDRYIKDKGLYRE